MTTVTETRPSPRSRRPRRPSLGHEEFLDRALDLFLEQGFERTSIEAICAGVGMAKRTVYLRYGDKASLFKTALGRAIDEWVVPVERLRAAETDELEATLVAIGRILVANVLSPAGVRLLRLVNAVAQAPDVGPFTVELGSDRHVAYLAGLFRRRLGPRPDAEQAAEAFLHLVVGGPATAAAWGVQRDAGSIERRVRYSVRLFLGGLVGSGDAAAASSLDAEVGRLRSLLAETLGKLDALRNGEPS